MSIQFNIFEYSDELFASCAESLRTDDDRAENQEGEEPPSDLQQSCHELFNLHANHYGRPSLSVDDDKPLAKNDAMRRRLSRFLSSVLKISQHQRARAGSDQIQLQMDHNEHHSLYDIGLNQFSDILPPMAPESATTKLQRSTWRNLWEEDMILPPEQQPDPFPFARLLDEDSVLAASQKYNRNHIISYQVLDELSNHDDDENSTLTKQGNRPVHETGSPFHSSVNLPEGSIGSKVHLEEGKHKGASRDEDGDGGVKDKSIYVGPFERTLNWADASNNPDGVGLVHDAFDQGKCGSCWAYAATGTVEASAARHEAQVAYTKYKASSKRPKSHSARESRHRAAVSFAQNIELGTMQNTTLSIQELIDCDTNVDQGCIGGNPIQAFFFIHNYGLSSWEDYPYTAEEGTCRVDRVNRPIATVDSWGLLGKHHEDLIALVLRLIGPVAVSIDASDPSFAAYAGGIFNKVDCGNAPNHAVLIVGYGEDEVHIPSRSGTTSHSNTVRYWIVRNSWGVSWGEGGYMRIKRGNGDKGTRGLCGITHSPSIALGGSIIPGRKPLHVYEADFFKDNGQRTAGEAQSSICDRFKNGTSRCSCMRVSRFVGDQAVLLLSIASVLVALYAAIRFKRRSLGRGSSDLDSQSVSRDEVVESDTLVGKHRLYGTVDAPYQEYNTVDQYF